MLGDRPPCTRALELTGALCSILFEQAPGGIAC